ncbi:MAG: NYN domain-containing protein [Patescibacteria group bacterium]
MTVIKHKEQRVGVFIDTQNLYHSARNLYQARVNFGAVLKDAVAGRKLVRAVAYVITTEAGDEKNFFEALSKLGIETKTKDLQVFAGGAKKADWDVGLAVDAIKMSPRLDSVVIISGDGDFIPLVEYLQTIGVQVEVVSFGKSTSSKLREVVDDFVDLSENPRKYLMSSK